MEQSEKQALCGAPLHYGKAAVTYLVDEAISWESAYRELEIKDEDGKVLGYVDVKTVIRRRDESDERVQNA